MRLDPYARVDGTQFSATREDILRTHGRPQREARNAVGLHEMDYGKVVYRFQDCGRLEEVTAQAPVLSLGAVVIPFENLASFVRAQDSALFERAGFLVSPRFGLAFVPGEQYWVTALAQHCIPQWQAL